ncbi:2781_t:CDS:2 [Scutellospora calospora]|uniref:2781_t:CDS:1 n=1 Tax=Scutellospora calospora TaxID=85575 RepID=A0ACA9K5X3_9GLOM|nr:2781_t:CDS:2 [Scutellospora calospora]
MSFDYISSYAPTNEVMEDTNLSESSNSFLIKTTTNINMELGVNLSEQNLELLVETNDNSKIRQYMFEYTYSGKTIRDQVVDLSRQQNRSSGKISCSWHINLSKPKASAIGDMGSKQILPLLTAKFPDYIIHKYDLYNAIQKSYLTPHILAVQQQQINGSLLYHVQLWPKNNIYELQM